MKKKFTRVVSVAVCAMMLVSTTTACKSPENAKTVSSPSNTSTSVAGDPLGKYSSPITLTAVRSVDSTYKFDTSNPETSSLEKNVWSTAYQEQLGINIKYLWTCAPDQYDSKWNVSIASGDIPDIAPVDQTTYKMLVNADMVEDMTNVYQNYASDDYKKANKADSGITMKYSTANGKLLGLPITGQQPDNSPILMIRKDWLKAANLSEPKTIDDVYKVAQAFTQKKLGGKDTYGLVLDKDISAGVCDMTGFLNGCGAYYDMWIKDKSGNLAYGSIQPEMKTALQKLQKMYGEGLINKDFAVKDFNTAGQDIVAGKVGITFGNFTAPLIKIIDNIKADSKADWEALPIPTLDGSAAKPGASVQPATYLFVKKGIKNPEAAVKIANIGLKLVGQDYNKYGTSKDGIQRQKYEMTTIQQPWQNLNRHLQTADAIKTGDLTKFTNDLYKQTYTAVKSAIDGDRTQFGKLLVFGPSGTFSVINQYKVQNQVVVSAFQAMPTATMTTKGNTLKTALDAVVLKIIMGDNVNTFDQAVQNWKSMGGTDITNEVNDWYKKNK